MCSLIEKTAHQRHVYPKSSSPTPFYLAHHTLDKLEIGPAEWEGVTRPSRRSREKERKGGGGVDRWKGSRVRCHDSSRGVRTASRCQGDPISQRQCWAVVFGGGGGAFNISSTGCATGIRGFLLMSAHWFTLKHESVVAGETFLVNKKKWVENKPDWVQIPL